MDTALVVFISVAAGMVAGAFLYRLFAAPVIAAAKSEVARLQADVKAAEAALARYEAIIAGKIAQIRKDI
jgi:hypothetical protein